MSKLNLTEVSHLIANGQSLEEIAEHSGWSVDTLRQLKRSGIHKDELATERLYDEVEEAIDDRLSAELSAVQVERRFTDGGEDWYYDTLYEREEGDPEELNFNDY